MSLINPLKAIVTTSQTFERFDKEEGVNLFLPKLIFLSLQILALAVALYKTHTMGLLPVTSGDWTSYLPEKIYQEFSSLPV